jgi:penicillin-binding protein 2
VTDRSRQRLLVLQVLVLSLVVTLFGRLVYLQVVVGDEYQRAAADNLIREVVTPSVRGLILDAQGRALVQNRTTLVVSVDRTKVKDQDDEGAAVIKRLAKTLTMDEARIKDALTLCGAKGAAKAPRCWNGSPYQPIPIAKDVDATVALAITERRELYPGVTAELDSVREYPSPAGANAAHLVGYLGPVTDDEVTASTKGKNAADRSTLRRTDLVGRAGLEAQYDTYLRGVPGVQALAVNNAGVVTGTVDTTEPTPGNYVVTSIDAKVQAATEQALKDQIEAARSGDTFRCGGGCVADSGAAVVMDVNTGRVVAMASYPTYDPTVWVGGVSQKEYDQLVDPDSNTPLLNRSISGEFPPASTFKVVSTAAAARGGQSLNAYQPCTSEIQIGNTTKSNFESRGYGDISIKRAIEVSCNTVFYKLGYEAWLRDGGLDPIADVKEWFVNTARSFGYGTDTGIDLPSERSGRVVSREDRRQQWEENKEVWCKRGETGYPEVSDRSRAAYLKAIAKENCIDGWQYRGGDAANVAIGQGDTLVTPLQVARAYAAIANGGTLWQPQVVKAVVAPNGKVVKEFAPKKTGELPTSPEVLEYIQSALRGVSTDGSAKGLFADFPVAISAKTGSGQVAGNSDDISWFASYGPSKDAQYAVVMMINQGGTGSGTSGPGVKKIYQALFGVQGDSVDPAKSVLVGGTLPTSLPTVRKDGTVIVNGSSASRSSDNPSAAATTPAAERTTAPRRRPRPGRRAS